MMKTVAKIIILLVAFVTLKPAFIQAQADKAMFYGGFSYQFINIRDQTQPVGSVGFSYYYGVAGGMNYVLAHSNDQVSLGINPNANLSFSFSPSGLSFLGQAPVFLLARLGAGSTPYNTTKFGIGAGIGCNFSYLYEPSNGFTQISKGFYNPSAIVELNLKGRSSDYSLRFNWSIYRPAVDLFGGSYEIGSTGLSIVYRF